MRALLADPRLVGPLGLSFAFFAAFGPVYVALPTLLRDPALLGVYYTAFGVGSLLGASATGYLQRLRFTTVLPAVVLGFGLAMLPLALGAPTVVALPAFALAGAIWAPYTATSMALLQSTTADEQRASVLAANSAILVIAVPLGTSIGGPAVEHLGAQHALAISTFLIIALGVLVGLVRLLRGVDRRRAEEESRKFAEPGAELSALSVVLLRGKTGDPPGWRDSRERTVGCGVALFLSGSAVVGSRKAVATGRAG